MKPADQIALPLDWPQVGEDRRFIVSEANRAAFDHFRQWSLWPVKATILTGPRRSGRSLLARGFIDRVGGRLFDQADSHDEEELFHNIFTRRSPHHWTSCTMTIRTMTIMVRNTRS